MRKTLLSFLIICSLFQTNAQNNLWPSEAINTGSNSTYLIQDVSFDNGELLYGKIGAFFTNDEGELQNGGWVIWNNSATSIAVWADDLSGDSPEKDGFASGEDIFWLATIDNGITNFQATVQFAVGNNSYVSNGVNVISQFTISNTIYCVNDIDGDGICDENQNNGCTNSEATNYNVEATQDDGSCEFNIATSNQVTTCGGVFVDSGGSTGNYGNNENQTITIYPENIDEFVFLYFSEFQLESPLWDNMTIYDGEDINAPVLENFVGSLELLEQTVYASNTSGALTITFSSDGITDYTGWIAQISCTTDIFGCAEPDAYNFDPTATVDNGSCEPYIFGCTNPDADNFDSEANTENGSCIVLGCTDSNYSEFNPDANVDDGSCVVYEACPYDIYLEYDANAISYNVDSCQTLIVLGCIDSNYSEFNPNANVDDGSCNTFLNVLGCTDNNFIEFNPEANVDDGSCNTYIVLGCTDNNFIEFNPDANLNDGSCLTLIIYGCVNSNAFNYNSTANVDDGTCIIYGCMDEVADNYNEQANIDYGNCLYFGCMNITADNYYPLANVDDQSCIIYGCTIDLFPNYNPTATIDDFTCDTNSTVVYGCTDPNACNYNDEANTENGSCEFTASNIDCEGNCLNGFSICQNEFAQETYLPDGSGVSYETSITLDCFGESQILLNAYDIISVDINMEHSFTGDLDIYLTSPNGIQVTLFEQAGSSTWFGEATDQDATEYNPGIGYDYGWSMNPTYNGTMADGMIDNTTPAVGGFGNILNSDTYLPEGDFNDFIGTHLNGDWTLTVTDNLNIDNGWIFSWGITMNPVIVNNCLEIDSTLVYGCTDPDALNFDPTANLDDGSCDYDVIEGCTDSIAYNYNPQANYDDGSCVYDIVGVDEIDDFVSPKLIKMIDVLGREQQEHKIGSLLFYIYDTGLVIKQFKTE